MYHIENRIAGRVAGTTLYLVQARAIDGQIREVADENEKFKLFLIPCLTFCIASAKRNLNLSL